MKNFEEIFNECIEQMLLGKSIDECVAQYPEYAAELEPILQDVWYLTDMGSLINKSLASQDFRQSRSNVIERLSHRFNKRTRIIKPFVLALSSLGILLFIFAGVTFASQNSFPGQPLYNIKRVSEKAYLKLITNKQKRADAIVFLTLRRLYEYKASADENNQSELITTLQEYGAILYLNNQEIHATFIGLILNSELSEDIKDLIVKKDKENENKSKNDKKNSVKVEDNKRDSANDDANNDEGADDVDQDNENGAHEDFDDDENTSKKEEDEDVDDEDDTEDNGDEDDDEVDENND